MDSNSKENSVNLNENNANNEETKSNKRLNEQSSQNHADEGSKKDEDQEDKEKIKQSEEIENLDEMAYEDEDIEQTEEIDKRSVYVKNVDYMSTKEEVIDHFKECGKINRVTIITDKYTGHPKGYAYIEFNEAEGVENAKCLSDSLLRGRQIKVLAKRTNVPFKNKGRGMRRPRGPPFGGGGYRGNYYYRGYMFSGPPRGMRRGYRPY